MVVPAYPSCKHKHSVSNLLFVLHHYFNVFWKILRLRNSAWEFLRVNFCSGIFWGFVKSPRDFWVLIFAPIWLSPLLEIWSTPARMLTESWPSCQPSIGRLSWPIVRQRVPKLCKIHFEDTQLPLYIIIMSCSIFLGQYCKISKSVTCYMC